LPDESLLQQLREGVSGLQICLDDGQLGTLIAYVQLLKKWNRTHNLTSIDSLEEMLVKHLLDSLSTLPYISESAMLDVGSGAGLPSIPLAIARPGLNCTALDASHKRTVFMRTAARELALDNVEVVYSRVEKFQAKPFPLICSRAFSSLKQFVQSTGHLLQGDGSWIAMKGAIKELEREELPASIRVVKEVPLSVPGLQAERRVLFLKNTAPGISPEANTGV